MSICYDLFRYVQNEISPRVDQWITTQTGKQVDRDELTAVICGTSKDLFHQALQSYEQDMREAREPEKTGEPKDEEVAKKTSIPEKPKESKKSKKAEKSKEPSEPEEPEESEESETHPTVSQASEEDHQCHYRLTRTTKKQNKGDRCPRKAVENGFCRQHVKNGKRNSPKEKALPRPLVDGTVAQVSDGVKSIHLQVFHDYEKYGIQERNLYLEPKYRFLLRHDPNGYTALYVVDPDQLRVLSPDEKKIAKEHFHFTVLKEDIRVPIQRHSEKKSSENHPVQDDSPSPSQNPPNSPSSSLQANPENPTTSSSPESSDGFVKIAPKEEYSGANAILKQITLLEERIPGFKDMAMEEKIKIVQNAMK